MEWKSLWAAIIGGLIVGVPGGIAVYMFQFWCEGRRIARAKKEAEEREKRAVDAAREAQEVANTNAQKYGGLPINRLRAARQQIRRLRGIDYGAMSPAADPDESQSVAGGGEPTPAE